MGGGVDQADPGQRHPEAAGGRFERRRLAQHGQPGEALPGDLRRRLHRARVPAFRQHDVLRVGASPVFEYLQDLHLRAAPSYL